MDPLVVVVKTGLCVSVGGCFFPASLLYVGVTLHCYDNKKSVSAGSCSHLLRVLHHVFHVGVFHIVSTVQQAGV